MDDQPQKRRRLFYGPCAGVSHDARSEPPNPMTTACFEYFSQDAKLTKFMMFHFHLILLTQLLHKNAAEIKLNFDRKDVEEEFGRSFLAVVDTSRHEFDKHVQLLFEMAFCTMINNYLTYVSDLLSLIFRIKPESLRSSQTMELQDILRHGSMSELISTIADRKVSQLAYKGMGELNRSLKNTLGLTLFDDPEDLRRAKAFVEIRNVVVHGRSKVNSLYLSRLGYSDLKPGEEINVDSSMAIGATKFLSIGVSRLDRDAVSKFGLPTPVTREVCGL